MQKKRTILFALCLVVTVASWSVAPAADGPEDILLFSEAAGINNQGAIAGAGCTALCKTYEALRVRGETLDFLGTLGGFAAVAYDINGRGDTVGQADTGDVDANGVAVSLAFVAGRHDGAVRSLGSLPGYDHSQAFAINDAGEIVGWAYNTDLTRPGGLAPTFRGFHAGADGAMYDLGTLGGRNSAATDINDRGEIVGVSETGDIDPVFGPTTHGFVIGHIGGMRDLQSVITAVR